MVEPILWTASRSRLQLVQSSEKNLNWLFLPGGPGLGSESLVPLVNILELPGNLWLLDLPGDGSNTTSDNAESFSHWPSALLEAVNKFEHVILVAHSTGGMFALSLPELENCLEGLVLLDSAPDCRWQNAFEEAIQQSPISKAALLQDKYRAKPSNEALRDLTQASAPYLFSKESQKKGLTSLSSLPFNWETHLWSEKNFDPTYRAKWVPKSILTMILTGQQDKVTPERLFQDDRRFCRDNIIFKSIKKAGHFPWIENPTEVANAFKEFVDKFRKFRREFA